MSGLRARLGGVSGRVRDVRIRRPATRLGYVKLGVGIAIASVVMSAGLVVTAVAAATFYDQYGYHPEKNARAWASLTPQYAESAVCARCHTTEYGKWVYSKHDVVICETCHGPLAEHAATAPEPAAPAAPGPAAVEASASPAPAGSAEVVPPTEALCSICHQRTLGRPADFYQVDRATHYPGTSCLQCHDVHSAIAIPPPLVTHSLANVPECTACHGTTDMNGVKAMPAGHQPSSDAICLGCHTPRIQSW